MRLGEPDEIPDHQEVARELHLLDHADLAIQPLGVLGQVVLETPVRVQRLQAGAPLLEALAGHVLEVGIGGVPGGDVELREGLADLLEFHLAALGDLPGAIEGILDLAEHLHHLEARLQIEVRRPELQTGRSR